LLLSVQVIWTKSMAGPRSVGLPKLIQLVPARKVTVTNPLLQQSARPVPGPRPVPKPATVTTRVSVAGPSGMAMRS
jgi:hypothetical protein